MWLVGGVDTYLSLAEPCGLFMERVGLHNHLLQLVGGVAVDAILLLGRICTRFEKL